MSFSTRESCRLRDGSVVKYVVGPVSESVNQRANAERSVLEPYLQCVR